MKKEILAGVVIVGSIVVLAGVLMSNKASTSVPTVPPTSKVAPSVSTAKEGQMTYTLVDIAKHTSPTDCWFAMEGKVYDVTKVIASGKHPGGETINEGCGKDATELFNTRPMGSGTPHSDKARESLGNFYIGELKK